MNRQNPGIGWCDWTWNPITGCRHGCPWCYARAGYERFGRSFEPAFHPERLAEPARVKTPARIFLGSVTDLGSPGVEEAWLRRVVEATRAAPWHKYLVLTKAPERLPAWLFREPWWFGVTVTRQEDLVRVDRLFTASADRARFFASFEPLLGPVDPRRVPLAGHEGDTFNALDPDETGYESCGPQGWIDGPSLEWIIIGALTRGGRTVPPADGGTRLAWIEALRRAAVSAGVPVYEKKNLRQVIPGGVLWERLREFPMDIENPEADWARRYA